MAYDDLNNTQDPTTGERILTAWGDQVRTNQEDHESRISANASALTDHENAATAHDASAISIADAAAHYTVAEVEAALQDLGQEKNWVNPAEGLISGGSLVDSGVVDVWTQTATGESRLSFKVWVPTGATVLNTYIWWSPDTAAGGNVRWREWNLRTLTVGGSGSPAGTISANHLTAAPLVQHEIVRTQIVTNRAVTAGDLVVVSVDRNGSHADDTAPATRMYGTELVWS